jgi:hypothetical protein
MRQNLILAKICNVFHDNNKAVTFNFIADTMPEYAESEIKEQVNHLKESNVIVSCYGGKKYRRNKLV